MRTLLVSFALLDVTANALAASLAEGRWRTVVRIPGEELTVVVDLDQAPVAGDTVLIGVVYGTLESRDLTTGEVLWSFETEASKRNAGWMLTTDRRFNSAFFYRSGWREAPIVSTERQFSEIGRAHV